MDIMATSIHRNLLDLILLEEANYRCSTSTTKSNTKHQNSTLTLSKVLGFLRNHPMASVDVRHSRIGEKGLDRRHRFIRDVLTFRTADEQRRAVVLDAGVCLMVEWELAHIV